MGTEKEVRRKGEAREKGQRDGRKKGAGTGERIQQYFRRRKNNMVTRGRRKGKSGSP